MLPAEKAYLGCRMKADRSCTAADFQAERRVRENAPDGRETPHFSQRRQSWSYWQTKSGAKRMGREARDNKRKGDFSGFANWIRRLDMS